MFPLNLKCVNARREQLIVPLFSVLISLTLACRLAIAEGSATIDGENLRIEGLSLPCKRCSIQNEYCVLWLKNERILVPCEKAPLYLLPELALSAEGTAIDPKQLFSYLVRTELPERAQRAGLELLLATEAGGRIIQANTELLARKFRALLNELFANRRGNPEAWMAFFRLPSDRNDFSGYETKALVTLLHQELGLADLLVELSVSEPLQDRLVIEHLLAAFAKHQDLASSKATQLTGELRRAHTIVGACAEIPSAPIFPAGCNASALSETQPPLAHYLKRVQMQAVLEKINRTGQTARQIFNDLAETDVEQFRTRETHQAVLKALKLVSLDPSISNALLNGRIQKLVSVFAAEDKEIAQALAMALGTTGTTKQNSENVNGTLWTTLALVVLVVGAFAYCFRRRRVRPINLEDSTLTSDERSELSTLFRYFTLPGWASSRALHREYRRRAKELHPDVSRDPDSSEFSLLHERYKRAEELIKKRSCHEN